MDSFSPFLHFCFFCFFAFLCINLTDLADSESSFTKLNVSGFISKEMWLTIIHCAFDSGLTFS